jgi:hypothetical protein
MATSPAILSPVRLARSARNEGAMHKSKTMNAKVKAPGSMIRNRPAGINAGKNNAVTLAKNSAVIPLQDGIRVRIDPVTITQLHPAVQISRKLRPMSENHGGCDAAGLATTLRLGMRKRRH